MSPPLRRLVVVALAAVVVTGVVFAYFGLRASPADERDTATVAAAAATTPAGGAEAARPALDRGNAAFRQGRYADALAHYRTAARAAPASAAPQYGIHMAARKLDDAALADSARAAIARLTDTVAAPRDTSAGAIPTPDGAP